MAVGDGFISGEEKFGDYTQFRNTAKHTFATNKIPLVKDNDDLAYFDRFIPLRFDNTPEKMDLFLTDKLTTPEELSGILNWALEGLYRLIQNGKFSYARPAEEIKKIMETSGNPLLQFEAEVLEESKDGKVTKEEMFEVYSIWAREKDKPKLSKNQLSIQLGKTIKWLMDKRDNVRYWANVKLRDEWASKLQKKDASGINEGIDDLDAFSNIKGKTGIVYDGLDITFQKASNSSEELEQDMLSSVNPNVCCSSGCENKATREYLGRRLCYMHYTLFSKEIGK